MRFYVTFFAPGAVLQRFRYLLTPRCVSCGFVEVAPLTPNVVAVDLPVELAVDAAVDLLGLPVRAAAPICHLFYTDRATPGSSADCGLFSAVASCI